MIALSAVQLSAQRFIRYAILFIDTSDNQQIANIETDHYPLAAGICISSADIPGYHWSGILRIKNTLLVILSKRPEYHFLVKDVGVKCDV